jgi:hypothetical protein
MQETQSAMNPSSPPLIRPIAVWRLSLENQIADFLDGKTHGESLLHALYDHILDEPVPETMRGLFK